MKRRTYLSSLAASTIIPSTQTTQPTINEVKQALSEYAFIHENSEYVEFFYDTGTLRVYYYPDTDSYRYSIGLADFIEFSNLNTAQKAVKKGKKWEYEARQEGKERYVKELSQTGTRNRIQYRINTEGERTETIYFNEDRIQEDQIIPIVISDRTSPRIGTL